MYKVLTLVFLFFSSLIFSQKELDINQKGAKQAVLDFFEGFHKGDTKLLRKMIDGNMTLRTIAKNKEGKIRVVKTEVDKLVQAVYNKPKDQKWYEKLLSFKIEANSDIAQVWTPYEFYVNDAYSHCGVNIFQLYNDGDHWKIIAISDTRKKDTCN